MLTYMCLNEMGNMKILKYFLISFFVLSMIDGQEIRKDGKTPKTFTYDEALEMLKARDAQWEGKLAKADSLIEMYKYGEEMYEDTIIEVSPRDNEDNLRTEDIINIIEKNNDNI